jgi:hypothetical protein
MLESRFGKAACLAALCAAVSCGSCKGHPGPCGPSNCLGCCDTAGECQRGVDRAECGFGGGSCAICNVTQACNSGQCGAPFDGGHPDGGDAGCSLQNCYGCCDSSGECVLGQDQNACGASGAACAACDAGQTCDPLAGTDAGGQCDSPCNASNCPGCCSGGVCAFDGMQNPNACGVNGADCVSCDGGSCSQGFCVSCGPGCAGCCFGTNCIEPAQQSDTLCGTGGVFCAACSSNQTCNFGSCTANTNVGDPCTQPFDCTALGSFALCQLTTGTVVYLGGYCTVDCSFATGTGGVCPGSSTCTDLGGKFGEINTLCIGPCNAPPVSCREPGYACYALDFADSGCWLDPPAPDGLEGTPCAADPSCQQATGPGEGYCVRSTLVDGGPSGFPGGMCSADCTGWLSAGQPVGDFYCGDGGACVTLDDAGLVATCFQGCLHPFAGQDSCRSGYVCRPRPGASGYCSPNCTDPGAPCPSGTSCAGGGYCCDAGTCF